MADAAVTFLLENVSRLPTSYADLISGAAENELRMLKDQLVLLKDFLQNAARNVKEKKFREIERQIKEVVYDAEDTIDACLTHLTAAMDNKNILRRRRDLNPTSPPVSLTQELKSLREDKLKPMLSKLMSTDFAKVRIGDESGTSMEKQRTRVKRVPLIRQETIVGLRDEERTLLYHLIGEEKEKLDIVTIVGMPGLGKTTLAWKLYHNHKIQYAFPTRIWVYVSQEFNRKILFLSILQEFTSKDMSSQSDHDLALNVRAFLETKKFLLVLDDVWTTEAWDAIRDALPMSNGRSKVIITSRIMEVGRHADHSKQPHTLRFLTHEEGWELLHLKVFGRLRKWPIELAEIGKHITVKCEGLPILILMIAGVLLEQLSKSREMSAIINAWQELSESLSVYLGSLGEVFSSVLALSYDRLRDDLRDCFLYLGVFPEDYEIPVWTLTQLWIAEGFIQPNQGQSLEETAEENLNGLINRNLVSVEKLKADGKVKTFRIHDTVRDFCITEAERKENLFQELRRDRHDGSFGPLNSDLQKHRRLCIHFNVLDFFSLEPYVPHVRSFLSFSKEEVTLQTEDIPKIPSAFQLIRILHVKSIIFRIFPLQLTQLVHLRYIVLSSDFKVLPEAVSKLRNTQTLIIQTLSGTLLVKADIWKMIQLRHVKTNASIILLKKPTDNEGKNLQTLANLSPENCTVDLFKQTPYLKKLGIRGRLATLLDFDSLEKLSNLENLKLLNDVYTISPSEGRLPCLPPPEKFPPKLRNLTLSATFLSWEQMSVLGNLENLEVLKLKENAFLGECWEVADGGFPLLQFLLIEYSNLVTWKALGDHFPRLERLKLRNCDELEELPDGLANMPSLQVIDLHRTSKAAASSARKIQRKISNREFKLSIFHLDK